MELPKTQIKNPLTIIAIFAAISEISGTAILPLLEESLQQYFIWFVMGFPILLVLLFFITLFTKHHVLYAPSDYKSDKSFADLAFKIHPSPPEDIRDKIKNSRLELNTYREDSVEDKKQTKNNTRSNFNESLNYYVAEDLALKKLSKENRGGFLSNQVFEIKGQKFQLNGMVITEKELSFFEIKYFPSNNTPLNGVGKTVKQFETIYSLLLNSEPRPFGYYIVIVTDMSDEDKNNLTLRLKQSFGERKPPINFIIYDFTKLKEEFGIQ